MTYDGLRLLIMAEDDLTCCFGLHGSLFHPYIVKKRPIWVVFQGASDGNVKTSRNIARMLKNSETLNFLKIDFLNFFFSSFLDFWLIFRRPGALPSNAQ